MFSRKSRIIILAPHTDDGEFGCGGTVNRLLEEGHEVTYIAFSAAEQSVPAPWPKDVLRGEIKEALAELGDGRISLHVLDYPVRRFPEHRQPILDDMLRLREEIKPHVVFLPSPNDTHQDHQVISQEGFRAFKAITILGYEVPWNNLTMRTTSFVILDEQHVQKKIQALLCYQSQAGRPYASAEFVRSLARVRGTQIGSTYAEAFETVRLVYDHN